MKKHIFILISFVFALVISAKYNYLASLPYEDGRYFDSVKEIVYHQQALIGYGFISFCLWILTILLIYWRTKKR